MKSISLFEERGSFLNGITPGVKALYILTALLTPIILGNTLVSGIFIATSVLLLIHSGVIRKTLPILCVSGFVMLTVVVIQGMFRAGNITPVFSLGIITFYAEGLNFALNIVLNIMNIIFSFCVLVLTTKPSDLTDAMVRRGLSPRIGYVFVSLFLLIPQMTDRMATISDSQRSRGMETEGNLIVRAKAFLPLISPVIMSSLMDTKERSIALEVRGFNAQTQRSFLNEFTPSKFDKIMKFILIFVLILAILGRVALWLI